MQKSHCSVKSLLLLPERKRTQLLNSLTPEESAVLLYEWEFWARENQLEPAGEFWDFWLILAGRGFGKTRTGAEWVRSYVEQGKAGRIALVAKDPAEARDVMIEGPSGILTVSPSWDRPSYEPTKKRITWRNGAQAFIYSSEDPEELRGPQHDLAWVDELFKFKKQMEVWDQLMFGLRIGRHPRVCVTSTPKPTKLLKMLLKDPATVVTTGSTYENLPNLSKIYRNIIKRYEGTRLGRQELNAEILDDNPGALWNYGLIDRNRLKSVPDGVYMKRIVIGVDPEASSDEGAAETGIVAAGLGSDDHYYVLADVSERGRPEVWGRRVVTAYNELGADLVVPEKNNGGEMVESTIRSIRDDDDQPIGRQTAIKLVHASRGKITRAEPISSLYEQNLVHHIGLFPELEDQMCDYDPMTSKVSPDRMDALVWALTELSNKGFVDIEKDTFIVGKVISRERYLQ